VKKKRLLYALESAGGGTLKHVTCLATRLNRDEFDITVVLPNEVYEADTQAAVVFMRQKGICVDTVFMPGYVSLKDVRALFEICFYLRKKRFDIVHAHSSKAGALFRMAAFFMQVPVMVYTPHCFYFQTCTGYKRRFYMWIERILAKRTHALVVSGTEWSILKQARIHPVTKAVIIDNAIDPDNYIRMNCRQARSTWNIPDSHRIVIGVGRMVKQKNWNRFIETARMVLQHDRNVTFIIAGEGPFRNSLTKQIDRYGISDQVRICGHVDSVEPLYSMADVFVATSLWEGLPYTYLEALHFNIPMLVTYTDGMEYFAGKTGIVCLPQNDTYRLSEEILKIISDRFVPDKRNDTENPFPFKRFVEQHRDLYRRLLPQV
jgi:glycosyltransferase involved in cell wall biosynthesis